MNRIFIDMIIDVWKPKPKKIDGKKIISFYEKSDVNTLTTEEKKGWVVIYKCDRCGNIGKTTSHVLFNGRGELNTVDNQTCRKCRSEISEYEIKKNFIPFNVIKESIEGENYVLLSTENEYLNSKRRSQFKHKIKCENNHSLHTTWNNWSKGKRCRLCYENNKFDNAVKYKNGWERYKFLVWYYTEKSFKENYYTINPNNYVRGKDYHLDHKYSIYEGFLNKVSPKIIGASHNLEVIDSLSNLKKHKKCSLTIEKLYENEKKNN